MGMNKQELMKVREQATKDMALIEINPGHLIKKFQLLSEKDKRDVLFELNLNLILDGYIEKLKHGIETDKKEKVIQFPIR